MMEDSDEILVLSCIDGDRMIKIHIHSLECLWVDPGVGGVKVMRIIVTVIYSIIKCLANYLLDTWSASKAPLFNA